MLMHLADKYMHKDYFVDPFAEVSIHMFSPTWICMTIVANSGWASPFHFSHIIVYCF
jgi:hypothetical protein